MEVRITFRSEIYVSGKTLAECKEQWEEMSLFSADALLKNHANFVEVCSIEDADTYEDLEDEWDKDEDEDDEEQDDDITCCPYCGSENIEWVGDAFEPSNATPYHCHECDKFFGKEDTEREDIRHKISAILMDTDEQHPKKCDIVIEDEEACGLSTLQMPHIDECFQEPSEGIIWFHFEGHYKNIDTSEKEWTDIDDLDISTLRVILENLQENQ